MSESLSSSSSANDTYTGTPRRITSVFSSCANGVFELSFAPFKLGVSTKMSSGAYPSSSKNAISSTSSCDATSNAFPTRYVTGGPAGSPREGLGSARRHGKPNMASLTKEAMLGVARKDVRRVRWRHAGGSSSDASDERR